MVHAKSGISPMSVEERGMRQALALAARGCGFVEPNPMVGAVVLDANGKVVGEGWHERFGAAHAEVNAFAMAGERARGGTLVVTLEPCCHHGKTPPCTEAVLRSGVRRAVVAMADPFPKVAGGGLAILRTAGIEVEVGLLEDDAKRLNAPYMKLLATGRPWVHLKWAMSLDGKIATRTGDSKWISGEESRAVVHELRGRMDAILVGAGTLRADDPLLTARPPGPRMPTRIVVTRTGELPAKSRLLETIAEAPVMVFTSKAGESRLANWQSSGAEVLVGESIDELLRALGRRRKTNILVEGGSQLLGSFLDANLADEIHAFVAPIIVGGAGPGPVAGIGFERIADALKLVESDIRTVGSDAYIHGRLR
jgi:diaminohydroxyphosphoribosylaminopyrimidine deaminase/5-amino-6-(5-phosphoribosylamino)uracil reductase